MSRHSDFADVAGARLDAETRMRSRLAKGQKGPTPAQRRAVEHAQSTQHRGFEGIN